jgi:hypothetical protein
MKTTRAPNPTIQRMGASRLAQSGFLSPWRLAPTADGDRWPLSRSAISKTPTVFRNKAQGSPLCPNDNKLPRIWNNPPQPQNAETNKPQKERGTLG